MSTLSRRSFLGTGAMAMAGVNLGAAGGESPRNNDQAARKPDPQFASVEALVFDTFGTVVDWRSSVANEIQTLAKRKGFSVDGAKFADTWRAGYAPSMNKVRTGEMPWTRLDDLHRIILDKILIEFDIKGLSEEEKQNLNHAWRRLKPWQDSVAGLTRLKKSFTIAPLSNGNIALMTALAKHSGLPWDCILGAELVRHYKPDREVYLSAADFLDLKVDQVMMVAAHLGDLRAAKALGLKTAFVTRPHEFGPDGKPDLKSDGSADLSATDFSDLAKQLGA